MFNGSELFHHMFSLDVPIEQRPFPSHSSTLQIKMLIAGVLKEFSGVEVAALLKKVFQI